MTELEYREEARKIFDKYWDKKWFNGTKINSMTKQSAKDFALLEVSSMIVELNSIIESLDSSSDYDWWYQNKVENRLRHYNYIIREIENL